MCSLIGVAMGMQGVSNVMQGIAAKERGDAAKAEDYRSADAAERAAADAAERGKLKEAQVAAHGSAVVGEQRLIFSSSGADVNVGAPKATQEATEAATEADKATVAHNAEMQAYGLKSRARAYRQAGVNAQAVGDAAMVGTFLGGIGKTVGQGGGLAVDVSGAPDEEGG